MKLSHSSALVCLLLATLAVPLKLTAKDTSAKNAKPEVTWVYPVIPKFGPVHPRPDLGGQPDPDVDYKVFVDVVSVSKDKGKAMGSLGRLARLVNLMGYAKVPPEHVHIVALLDRESGEAGMFNSLYRKYYKKDNPNLEILHALRKAGVELLVCSQAIAEAGLEDSDVDPSVTVTLSGVMAPVVYGQRGYTFVQF
jgi:intracellular sulfur oxidation DsrE/DsrF family protein